MAPYSVSVLGLSGKLNAIYFVRFFVSVLAGHAITHVSLEPKFCRVHAVYFDSGVVFKNFCYCERFTGRGS